MKNITKKALCVVLMLTGSQAVFAAEATGWGEWAQSRGSNVWNSAATTGSNWLNSATESNAWKSAATTGSNLLEGATTWGSTQWANSASQREAASAWLAATTTNCGLTQERSDAARAFCNDYKKELALGTGVLVGSYLVYRVFSAKRTKKAAHKAAKEAANRVADELDAFVVKQKQEKLEQGLVVVLDSVNQDPREACKVTSLIELRKHVENSTLAQSYKRINGKKYMVFFPKSA